MTTIFDDLLRAFHELLAGIEHPLVREVVGQIDWAMPARRLEPNALPCLRHMDRAVEIAPAFARPLVRLLGEHRGALRWGQTYSEAEMGPGFIQNYGWLEVFGTRGHFANEHTAAGFLLLGPSVLYPDHHHEAEEIYLPLSDGADWRMGNGDFVPRKAGEVVHHRPNVNHAMRTATEPLLAIYLWRGGPLAAKSTVTGVVERAQ